VHGKYITFILERKEGLRLGLARYKLITIDEFRNIIEGFFIPDIIIQIIQEIIERQYLIIYMSRVGITQDFKGIGFGSTLQGLIDAHVRITYPNFLLVAIANIKMFKLIKSRYRSEDFKKKYIYSDIHYSEEWEVDFRIILKRVLDSCNLDNYEKPSYV